MRFVESVINCDLYFLNFLQKLRNASKPTNRQSQYPKKFREGISTVNHPTKVNGIVSVTRNIIGLPLPNALKMFQAVPYQCLYVRSWYHAYIPDHITHMSTCSTFVAVDEGAKRQQVVVSATMPL